MYTNATKDEQKQALDLINTKYDGNVILKDEGQGKFKLSVQDCHKPGSIRSSSGSRRFSHACYHVHGDFFDALFKVNPSAWVRSLGQKIDKDGGNWGTVGDLPKRCDCKTQGLTLIRF